jgi:hypothetical protein
MEYSAYQKTAISCAKEAGEVIKAAWDNLRHVVNKGEVDLVCTSDQSDRLDEKETSKTCARQVRYCRSQKQISGARN